MDVILKKDIDNLGFEYEIVSVKPGYARNFLIPQGWASLATSKAKEELEKTLAAREAEEQALIQEATKKVNALKELELKLTAKAGEGDKLFGSINNADLTEALEKKGVSIDRRFVKIPGNTIKRTGNYTAKIKLHRKVETEFAFEVIAE